MSRPPSAAAVKDYEAARAAYESGRPDQALRRLQAVLQAEPGLGQARHLAAMCLLAMGQADAAEQQIRTALQADKRQPLLHAGLGDVMQRTGRPIDAEKAYRAALALDRMSAAAAVGLSHLLISLGRAQEALQVTTPLAAASSPAFHVLEAHAEALKALGRPEEALILLQRSARQGSPFAELEIAGVLRDLGRYQEAEAAARRAYAVAGETAPVLIVHGRALQDLGRIEEAEAAFRKALTQVPLDPVAHHALAELIWRKTGDPERAWTPLDSVIRQRPLPALLALKARLLTLAGRPEEAFATLKDAAEQAPGDALLQAAAATAAVHAKQAQAGLALAERAAAVAPGVPKITALLAETCLAAGQPERTAALAEQLLKDQPDDQPVIALQAVSWRLMGNPRYRELYDYPAMVRSCVIPTPKGWDTLETYLGDLAQALKALHALSGDPLEQSVRDGAQTQQNLALSKDPVIRAFLQAVEAPVAAYVAGLGRGKDPLRSRNLGGHKVKAAWSVELRPDGFHVNHLHPDGWISSAFYVELPETIGGETGREGWLKFGEPGIPTPTPLPPEHFERPELGKLVLFPSYMWHGTVPFPGEQTRLTMAFDVVPAKRG